MVPMKRGQNKGHSVLTRAVKQHDPSWAPSSIEARGLRVPMLRRFRSHCSEKQQIIGQLLCCVDDCLTLSHVRRSEAKKEAGERKRSKVRLVEPHMHHLTEKRARSKARGTKLERRVVCAFLDSQQVVDGT